MPTSDSMQSQVPRPTLAADPAYVPTAHEAVAQLVHDLQAGWNAHDADITDRRLAADVLWGSPFGATVSGYDALHSMHVRLKQRATGGRSSRFEVVQSLSPQPGIVITQVRRVALDDEGQPVKPNRSTDGEFSEMAMYVLVERDGGWWVAAGQNTPIAGQPPA